jgi:hypothetical protein
MKKWLLNSFLIITLLESLLVAGNLANRLIQAGNLRSPFSLISLLLIGFLALIIVGLTVLMVMNLRGSPLIKKLKVVIEDRRWYWGLVIFFALVLFECVQDLLYLGANLPEGYYPIILLENIPLLLWAGAVSFQSLLLLIFVGKKPQEKKPRKEQIIPWMIPGILLIAFVVMVVVNGTGFIPHSSKITRFVGFFDTTNAPLPMIQVVFIWIFVTGGWLGIDWLRKRWKVLEPVFKNELVILILLWGVAFLLWCNVPLQENYFIEPPRSPNYQFTVRSDAIYYDIQAHRYLAGEGFVENVQHPLYSYLLSGLHLLGGDHYLDIYRLQIALLALTPFLLFKLTSQLHNRYSGWLIALFYIFREYNALNLGDSITISNVNVLLTEPTTLLGVVLVVYLLVSWLQAPEGRKAMPFLIGTVIGLLALIRIELLSLVLVFGIITLLVFWKKWKSWLRDIIVLIAAVSIIAIPWMVRNWDITGDFYLDKNDLFVRAIQTYASQLFQDKEGVPPPQPQQSNQPDDYSLNKLEKIWLHTQSSITESVLYLPSNHLPLGGLDNYVRIVPDKGKVVFFEQGIFSDQYLTSYIKSLPYWQYNWDGLIVSRSILPLIFVSGLCLTGAWMVWEKKRWIGLTPALVWGSHIFSYALFSSSGGRQIQVVDWVTLLYFGLGISWLTARVGLLMTGNDKLFGLDDQASAETNLAQQAPPLKKTNRRILVWSMVLILVGFSLPISEYLIPIRYTQASMENRLEQVSKILSKNEETLAVQGDDGLIQLYGKALYPGYYRAGEFVLDDRSGRVPDSTPSRVVFYLVGMENIWVSIPVEDAPEYFPHGAEVVVEGRITRDSEEDLKNRLRPYFLGTKATIFRDGKKPIFILVDCESDTCLE